MNGKLSFQISMISWRQAVGRGQDVKNFLKQIHLDNLNLERQQLKNAHNTWKNVKEIDLSDHVSVPFHLHIGMRTLKTMIGVFLSGLIGWILHQPPLFSMFACILCMQNKTNDTIKSGYNRMLGTLVGGFYAMILVYTCWMMKIPLDSLLYYTLIALTIFPVISTTLFIRKPTTSALSCIVLVAITLSEFNNLNPLLTALWRMIDTLIGIGIVVLLEYIFPYFPNKEGEKAVSTSDAEGK